MTKKIIAATLLRKEQFHFVHQASESAFVGKTRKNTFANTDLRETKGAESLYEGMGNLFAIFFANNKRHQDFGVGRKRLVLPDLKSLLKKTKCAANVTVGKSSGR